MSTSAAAVDRPRDGDRMAPQRLGMLLFVCSEVMFFGGLFAAYFALRALEVSWPPEGTPRLSFGLPALFSALLVASSLTMHVAVGARLRGDRVWARWLGLTIALGTVFLGGQVWEYAELGREGFGLSSNAYGSLFFTMTGFHGLHVLGGLALLSLLLVRSLAGSDRVGHPGFAEACGYYWHFVDAVWVLLFVTLYVVR
ncbi:MAG: heme-copper oxidase subunit III [Actinomycetota bacterium]